MRRTVFHCWLCSFLLALPILAQQAPSKDSLALSLAQYSLQAMGGANLAQANADSESSGTLTVYTPDGPVPMPVVYRTRGTNRIRVELHQKSGITIRIVNNGDGAILKPDGTIVKLLLNNTLAERVTHIPAFSLLNEAQSPTIKIQNAGTSMVNKQPAQSLSMSEIPNSNSPDAPFFEKMTLHVFHLDPVTGLVLKMDYSNCAENDSNACQKVERLFMDYRNVQGVLVPFHQMSYVDARLDSDLVLSSVSFNVGLTDSLFTLPQ